MVEGTISPEQKVVKVVRQNEAKAGESTTRASESTARADQARQEAVQIEQIKTDLRNQIEDTNTIRETRGKLEQLSAAVSGRSSQEKKGLKTLDEQLAKREVEFIKLTEQEDTNRVEAGIEEKTARHASTVAEANKSNVTKEEEEKKPWEERIVPIQGSEALKNALDRQTELSRGLKFYAEHGYSAEPQHLIPLPLAELLKESISYRIKGNQQIEKKIVDITPLYEEIIKLSDEKGIPVSQNLIARAVTEGLHITDHLRSSEVWNFVSDKLGSRATSSNIGYYEIGAANLEKFFAQRKNIQGENRLPYVIAYAAGALVNEAPRHMIQHLRNWIAETIPVAQTETVRENGQWVQKPKEPAPLGYGYFINHNPYDLEKFGTRDKGVVEAIIKANETALKIFDTLREKRRFDMEKHYVSGLGYGRVELKAPRLIVDNQT